jgi:hypothetical protein
MSDTISSGMKIGVTMCVVIAIVSTILLLFQAGMNVTREYVTEMSFDTATLHSGELGEMVYYGDPVPVPMIYNALMRSEDNWTEIKIGSSTVSPDTLLNNFHRKATVKVTDSTVTLEYQS